MRKELRESRTAQPPVRVGVPLEFPAVHLSNVLARLSEAEPDLRVDLRHAASATQWQALRDDDLDVALVREQSPDENYDAVLAVEESMGVIVADHARVKEARDGVELRSLAGLKWVAFARSDSPWWWDQVAATLRANGIKVEPQPESNRRPMTAEVKLAAVATGRSFALASPCGRRLFRRG